jgi:hypothetical protein
MFKSKILFLGSTSAIVILCLFGCSSPTFHSSHFDLASTNSSGDGVPYFLPTGYIHFVADMQAGSTGSVKTAASPSSNAAPAGININVTQNNYQASSPSNPPSGQPGAGGGKPADPGGPTQKSPSYSIKVDAMLSPDPNALYLLNPLYSNWANDAFNIGISNGLLTTINSSNSDQSGQVLVKLAQLAGDIVYLAGQVGAFTVSHPGLSTNLPSKIDVIIDPAHLEDASQILAQGNLCLTAVPFGWTSSASANPPAETDKIFYRPLLPWKVQVTDTNNHSIYSAVLMLPNNAPVLSLTPLRTSFVTAKTAINFSQGSPISFSYDRESPYLAIAGLPVDMIKAFLSAPTDLIQLKLNYVNTNSQLLSSQATEAQNQLKLLQQQVALEEFIRTNKIQP